MSAFQKPFAVILAAGTSARMSYPKAHLTLNGAPAAIHQARALLAVCERVIVVAGWNTHALLPYSGPKIKVIPSVRWWSEEPIESIRHGLRALPHGDVLILPVDAPVPSVDTLRKIAMTSGTVVPTHRSIPGHPVKLAKELRERVLTQPTSTGLRNFLTDAEHIEVPDPAVLLNLNTPSAWARWLRIHSTKEEVSAIPNTKGTER